MRMTRLIGALTCFLLACGGDVFGGFDASTDGGGDAAADASDAAADASDAGTFACGATSCSGDAICIHPCCGGAMICAPLEDGGGCPNGLAISPMCPKTAPCSNVCDPGPPFCGTTMQCPMPTGHDCYELCQ
jgi:hypothetical protein